MSLTFVKKKEPRNNYQIILECIALFFFPLPAPRTVLHRNFTLGAVLSTIFEFCLVSMSPRTRQDTLGVLQRFTFFPEKIGVHWYHTYYLVTKRYNPIKISIVINQPCKIWQEDLIEEGTFSIVSSRQWKKLRTKIVQRGHITWNKI